MRSMPMRIDLEHGGSVLLVGEGKGKNPTPALSAVLQHIGDIVTFGFLSSSERKLVEAAQREMEKKPGTAVEANLSAERG